MIKEKEIKTKLKKNDLVQVVAGKNKGDTGKVLEVNRKNGKVLVEGINIVKKTVKKSQENQQGGIISKEAYIDLSNVMYYDQKSEKVSRIGYKTDESGKKVRFLKKTGEIIND